MDLEAYNIRDSNSKYPGLFFADASIIENYGICPYIKYNSTADTVEYQDKQRYNFLQQTKDNGKQYFELLKKYDKKNLDNLKEQIDTIHIEFENWVGDTFVDYPLTSQFIDLLKCKSCNNNKTTVNNDSNIIYQFCKQTEIDFVTIVNKLYQRKFLVSKLLQPTTTTTGTGTTAFNIPEKVANWIRQYNTSYSNHKDLKNNHYKFVSSCQKVLLRILQTPSNQIGRYFKRWAALGSESQHERIESYYTDFAHTRSLPTNIVISLTNKTCEMLDSKQLKSQHIKWDTKLGIITNLLVEIEFNPISIKPILIHHRANSKKLVRNTSSKKAQQEEHKNEQQQQQQEQNTLKTKKRKNYSNNNYDDNNIETIPKERLDRLLLWVFALTNNQLTKSQAIDFVSKEVNNKHNNDYVAYKYEQMMSIFNKHLS